MPPRLLTQLSNRIRQTTEQLLTLKSERERLMAEVNLMKDENRQARRFAREHAELLAERERVQKRLEDLLEKLTQLKF